MALTLLRKQPPFAIDLGWAKKHPAEALASTKRCGVVLPGTATARSQPTLRAAPSKAIPSNIPDAMRKGLSNDVIHGLVRDGVLTRPALFSAMWEFGDQSLLAEAVRRGLIW